MIFKTTTREYEQDNTAYKEEVTTLFGIPIKTNTYITTNNSIVRGLKQQNKKPRVIIKGFKLD